MAGRALVAEGVPGLRLPVARGLRGRPPLTLIRGVGVSQNGASRWIAIGGYQIQPSELAKLALAVWGADLLARKEKLGQLVDWRHMLVPLMPGAGVLACSS